MNTIYRETVTKPLSAGHDYRRPQRATAGRRGWA